LFVFWYHSPNVLDTPHIYDISRLRVKTDYIETGKYCVIHCIFSNSFEVRMMDFFERKFLKKKMVGSTQT
jgi:hypothetical protein